MATKDQLLWLRATQRARNTRENFAAFRPLIETPGSLTTGVVMPANSRLGVSASVDVDPGALLVAVNGVDQGVAGGPADMVFLLGYFEKARTVTLGTGAVGDVSLYVLDGWNRPYLIATT